MSNPRLFNDWLESLELRIIQELLECNPHEVSVNLGKIYATYGRKFVEDIHHTLCKIIADKIQMLGTSKNKMPYNFFTRSKFKLLVSINCVEDEIIAFGKLRHEIRTILNSNGTPMLENIRI
jgi:hypothetical protein